MSIDSKLSYTFQSSYKCHKSKRKIETNWRISIIHLHIPEVANDQRDATKDIWTGNPISGTVEQNKIEVDSRPCPSGIPLVVNLTCNRNDRGTIDESHRIDSYRKADARSKIRTRSHASIRAKHWLRA